MKNLSRSVTPVVILALLAIFTVIPSATFSYAGEGNGKGNIDGNDEDCAQLNKDHPELQRQCQQKQQQQQQQQQQVLAKNPESTCYDLAYRLGWSVNAAETACTGTHYSAAPVSCAYYAFSIDRIIRVAGDGLQVARLCAGAIVPSAPIDCANILLERGISFTDAINSCRHARSAKRRIRCLDRAQKSGIVSDACTD